MASVRDTLSNRQRMPRAAPPEPMRPRGPAAATGRRPPASPAPRAALRRSARPCDRSRPGGFPRAQARAGIVSSAAGEYRSTSSTKRRVSPGDTAPAATTPRGARVSRPARMAWRTITRTAPSLTACEIGVLFAIAPSIGSCGARSIGGKILGVAALVSTASTAEPLNRSISPPVMTSVATMCIATSASSSLGLSRDRQLRDP